MSSENSVTVQGLEQTLETLVGIERMIFERLFKAALLIAAELEAYAKTHHGSEPNKARWIYTGTHRKVTVSNMYTKGGAIGKGSYMRATKRWREAGTGWMRVSGATDASTTGRVVLATAWEIVIELSAGMEYDQWLEKAKEGKWAWLFPALMANAEFIVKTFREAVTL